MAEILCGYTADRDETLVAYVYGEIEPAQRAAFEAHIATCERCGREVAELQGVRVRLQEWHAPDVARARAEPAIPALGLLSGSGRPQRAGAWRVLREIPAWAQVAAALLVLGVSAGVANLDVRYDVNGLRVRTGWSRPADAATADAAPVARPQPASAGANPWRTDLDALEKRLRTEFHPPANVATPILAREASGTVAADGQLLRKVRALLDDSERKQRNELALRIAEVVQEFDTKRGTDLANIRNIKTQQSATGVEIVRQQQWLDLLTRASMQGGRQ